jgi:hypothetical protein
MERLVAHWSFDENQGGTANDAVGGYQGQIQDAVWVDGRIGKALEFDGEKSFVSVSDADGLKNSPNGLTLEAWIMPKGAIDEFSVVIIREHPEYTLELLGESRLRATVNGLWAVNGSQAQVQ